MVSLALLYFFLALFIIGLGIYFIYCQKKINIKNQELRDQREALQKVYVQLDEFDEKISQYDKKIYKLNKFAKRMNHYMFDK